MKKVLLFSLLVCSFVSLKALTRISIINGDWSNPATWSPSGVPQFSDDSIIINTAVTFNVNISDGQYMFRIKPGASLIDLGMDTITLGGNDAVISGYMSCSMLAVGMSNQFYNSGAIAVSGDLGQSGTFLNAAAGSICVGQLLATSDNFTNNGSVSAHDWTNGAATNGSGRFCVANYFINTDNISGTLDICDATPNTAYDVNTGTIAGTVTHCAVGPCSLCPAPSSVNDIAETGWLKVGPDPFQDEISFFFDPRIASSALNAEVEIFDAMGTLVGKKTLSGGEDRIDTHSFSNGIYFYRVMLNSTLMTSGRIIRNG